MDTDNELAVVIVAYGDPEHLGRSISALDRSTRILIVDNGSSEVTEQIGTRYGARYVDPGQNLGFGAAVNLALGKLDLHRTDVLLLNPDATVDMVSLRRLRTSLHSSPRICCVAPAQNSPGEADAHKVCWPLPTAPGAWMEAFGMGRIWQRRWQFVIGSVLLIRGDALIDVGGFDESFFLYAEESDWQHRAIRRGWTPEYCPEAHATHIGAATDTDETRRELRFHAATELYVRKWSGQLGWTSYRCAVIVGSAIRAAARSGTGRQAALRRMKLYSKGPSAVAAREGALPPTKPAVPAFDGRS